MTLAPDFLEGAVDLHVHSAPDLDPRRFDDIELAREAAQAGMGAILIKSHQNSTVERAWLVSQVVPDIRVYGGLVLNETVGGLNPAAVELAISMGARQIWMPTRSAENHRRHHGMRGGISVLDANGQLVSAAEEILQQIARSHCILGTGHLSPEESSVVIDRASALGIRSLLVTHPEWPPTFYSLEAQKELSSRGNVIFERCFVSTTHRCGFVPFETIERAISDVGVGTTVLSTDLGQPDTPPPVEGLRLYAERLRSTGFSVDDIRLMMQTNPARLL
ncbi:MAG: hypothetical protein DMG05_26850 [Acidobacteria bacterium]|nr:MAG: hypothetical protein DMG05_26850 [Acidobacteriota bacterium]